MKACPVCGRLFPESAGFCPIEGTALVSATQVPIAPSDEDSRVGGVIANRYQVRRVVADGGMGRVYEALDLHHRRHVALKILHPEAAENPIALARFKREYEVSRQLPHEHFVEVLDFQRIDADSYVLVMEFLYGEELRNTLQRASVLAPARLIRMLSQMALGLDQAHRLKLVHRDLKPENIFLCQTPDGDTVKILDFGSVKDRADNAQKLTMDGTTIGSPYYMSPEQAHGLDTLDHRADVWALAAVTYECVTGKVPFAGLTAPSILLGILTKEPTPPSQVAPANGYPVPRSLDRVLRQGLSKDSSLRISSVGELADSLGAAYGLAGSHREWAFIPEGQLAREVGSVLAGVLAGDHVPRVPSHWPELPPASGANAVPDPSGTVSADALGQPVPAKEPPRAGLSWGALLFVGVFVMLFAFLAVVMLASDH